MRLTQNQPAPSSHTSCRFLSKSQRFYAVFVLRRAWQQFLAGQYRQTQLEGGDTKEVFCLLLFSFYSLAKNTLIYHYHPACGMA
jgi:hypothetical protein